MIENRVPAGYQSLRLGVGNLPRFSAPLAHARDAGRGAPGAHGGSLRAALAARAAPIRGCLVAPGRLSRERPDARAVDPGPAGAEGRRGGAVVARAARDRGRSRPPPRRVAARHGLPRAGAARARPGAAAGHVLAPARPPPRAGRLRPRADRARWARAPARQALLHEHRLRARAEVVLHLRAHRDLHGRPRLPRGSHQPAARARAPRPARGHRRAAPVRARGRPAGRALLVPVEGAGR